MNRLLVGIGITVAATLGIVGCGDSGDTPEGLSVSSAWARPTPEGATAGAVYVTVTATADDSIISASVSEDIAAAAQLHEVVAATEGSAPAMSTPATSTPAMSTPPMSGDTSTEQMMTMREVESVELEAGVPFDFAPGQTHIMIIDLVAPLTLGQEFTVELQLESGASVPLDVVVADSAPAE